MLIKKLLTFERMAEITTIKEMELFQLPDDALIELFTYLDRKAQLNTMLVCHRFERLIGETHQFFKNRKLQVGLDGRHLGRRENPDAIQTRSKKRKLDSEIFKPFGRYFGDVTVFCHRFNPSDPCFSPLLENLEAFGSKIIKFSIRSCSGYADRLLDVLRLVNNVQELTLSHIHIYVQLRIKKHQDLLTFPNLKSLELRSVDNFDLIQGVFNQIKSLHRLKLENKERFGNYDSEWERFQPIVIRQVKLRSLEIDNFVIDSFNWSELDMLEELTLNNVEFPKKEAFESFKNFIKSLKNISELNLRIDSDEIKNGNNYTEILTHLLKSRSLEKV